MFIFLKLYSFTLNSIIHFPLNFRLVLKLILSFISIDYFFCLWISSKLLKRLKGCISILELPLYLCQNQLNVFGGYFSRFLFCSINLLIYHSLDYCTYAVICKIRLITCSYCVYIFLQNCFTYF